jgi:hypothetical protein
VAVPFLVTPGSEQIRETMQKEGVIGPCRLHRIDRLWGLRAASLMLGCAAYRSL